MTEERRRTARCPLDGEAMETVRTAGIDADRCPRCGGVWLDRGELEHLLSSKADPRETIGRLDDAEAPAPRPERGVLICPRDGARLVRMRHLEQRHVEIDQCSTCGGVFLDPGELRDLDEFTLGERVRRAFGRA